MQKSQQSSDYYIYIDNKTNMRETTRVGEAIKRFTSPEVQAKHKTLIGRALLTMCLRGKRE